MPFHNTLAQGNSPNILLVLTDDQSWNGTSVLMDPSIAGSKSDFYQTPRLEELAAQGMRFTNGYSSASVCAPTRAAILTGMSPAQLQMTDLKDARPGTGRWTGLYSRLPLTGPAPQPLDPSLTSIPQILRQVDPNYAAAHYGKWHLNLEGQPAPPVFGYDDSLDPKAPGPEDPKGVGQLATLSSNFIEQQVNQGKPFFVQMSTRAVHDPVSAPQELIDKYSNLPAGTIHKSVDYAAMTEDLDNALGTVMDKLVELGVEDNTYVIFTSDNGAPTTLSSSTPLKRGKATLHEGGIRVPFVVSGPGIQQNSVSDVPITTTDLFSTIAGLAGNTATLPENVEGADFSSVLHNAGDLPTGVDHLARNFHEGGEIYWHSPHNYGIGPNYRIAPSSAIRDGDYKLHVHYGEHGGPDQLSLFNLSTDTGETFNLAASQPALAAQLKSKLDRYLERVDASFAFDVKDNITLEWSADTAGTESDAWRSQIRVKNKIRETFALSEGSESPTPLVANSYQRQLENQAFHFDGNDAMRRMFFQVGDLTDMRKNTPNAGTPDLNRSASMEFWVRLDSLSGEHILFESGDATNGLSVTLGDADADGKSNDVRFRVLADTQSNSSQDLTVTAKLDRFLDPTQDFFHVTTVFNDDPNDRYSEVYINGALAGRVAGVLGEGESLRWDAYDGAALGGISNNDINSGPGQLGGSGGTGDLPFAGGGFRGELANFRFYNHAIGASDVQSQYNSALAPTNQGIASFSGDALSPAVRPVNISHGAFESSSLIVIQERTDELAVQLVADALIASGQTLEDSSLGTMGTLPAGTDFVSYLMQFDPVGDSPGMLETVSGSIQFKDEIIGILFDSGSLVASDNLLNSVGEYGEDLDRGLTLSGNDFLTISEDLLTLDFSLSVDSDAMLQFRVLTDITLDGDINIDGYVDGADFLEFQRGFGTDYDANDLANIQDKYGSSAPGLATASAGQVPEPTALVLALFASSALIFRRRLALHRGAPAAL
ncbi:sulfatase-like hydrolase/transferase [Adhaeretor mobilis]|uniref:sulfatase-like hydrolase/transferase n=1 Tax=Adhaeretor mobilis TaxID=1930276 RepID=UPI001C54D463|nr:sulfatase-like hydrolase/transferase [Adhaeretor mobilis]